MFLNTDLHKKQLFFKYDSKFNILKTYSFQKSSEVIMQTREGWKEGKIPRILNGTVFYTDSSKLATRIEFRTYRVNIPTSKTAL